MKNLSNPKQQETPSFASPKSINKAIHPLLNRESSENVRLSGRSTGASMVVDGGSGESPGSCSINIYINNDVQGINNSVLFGSEVRIGDCGVRMCLEGMKIGSGEVHHVVSKNKDWDTHTWILLVGFIVMVISFLAYLFV
ncbi:hypothetical protein OROHE_005278 [Orobanche hederae]